MFFGVFSTELLPLPCKITDVGRLSLFIEFFVGFHIVCDRYTPDNAQFTFFNTIWPLSLSSGFGSEVYPWSESLSYVASCDGNGNGCTMALGNDNGYSAMAIWMGVHCNGKLMFTRGRGEEGGPSLAGRAGQVLREVNHRHCCHVTIIWSWSSY